MKFEPPATVIIVNHNYAPWLGEAIDSALAQTYPEVEVVVVDDGSTDSSRDVIASYRSHIRTVLKPNEGQAAAMNAGFAVSQGDPVIFLDADDVLLPEAVTSAAEVLKDPGIAQVHWHHIVIDGESQPTGERFPREPLPDGDLRESAVEEGPGVMATSPTSGNSFPRWFLDRIMPIAPLTIRMCADQYVIRLAPLFGRLAALDKPYSLYRRHERSGYAAASFERQLELGYETTEALMTPYARWCEELGLGADMGRWRSNSWFHRLRMMTLTLDALVPQEASLILIDDACTPMTTSAQRRVTPFPEQTGLWWGLPEDDAAAIAELERQRRSGASFLAVPWFARWWLRHFPRFTAHLGGEYEQLLDDELLTLFNLTA
jgi:hypothetical protein